MRMKTIGKTDIEVSEICLGTMTWGTQNSLQEGHEQINHAKEFGVNFMDTAEVYPVNPMTPEKAGRTEEIIGAYFETHGGREDWVVATKVAGNSANMRTPDITPESMDIAVERSLKKLKTDYIDLYQLHWPNRGSYHFRQHWTYDPRNQPAKEQILDNMRAVNLKMAELQKSGKVRAFGTSNESAWGMAQWLRIAEETGGPRMESIQNEYSLLCRLYDTDMAELAVHEEISLLAYSCLACGMLTGKYEGGATVPKGSRLDLNGDLGGRVTPNAWAATDAYLQVAKKHGLDPTAMAIAWTMTRPFEVMPIIGATSVEQLQKSLDGEALRLSDAVLMDLNKAHMSHAQPY